MLLNYSITCLTKDDPEGRIQALSALGGIASESEQQCKMRLEAAAKNYAFKSSESKDLAIAMGLITA